MRVIDPGHHYMLNVLDGEKPIFLRFVKRVGPKFPGNDSAYSGTTMQEVIRVLIDRLEYVDNQSPHIYNKFVLGLMRSCIWWLEKRAFERHNITFNLTSSHIEKLPTNKHGHLWNEEKL